MYFPYHCFWSLYYFCTTNVFSITKVILSYYWCTTNLLQPLCTTAELPFNYCVLLLHYWCNTIVIWYFCCTNFRKFYTHIIYIIVVLDIILLYYCCANVVLLLCKCCTAVVQLLYYWCYLVLVLLLYFCLELENENFAYSTICRFDSVEESTNLDPKFQLPTLTSLSKYTQIWSIC